MKIKVSSLLSLRIVLGVYHNIKNGEWSESCKKTFVVFKYIFAQ